MDSPTTDAKELDAIKQFRKKVTDVLQPHHTDHFLYRWLAYADFDLGESERTLRTCLLIRLCQQIERLPELLEVPEVWKKYGFSDFLGFDKDGIPVRYMPVGKADFDGIMRSISTVTMDRICAYVLSEDMKLLQERDNKIGRIRDEGQVVIFDLEGFSIHQFAHKHVLECLIDLMKMYQEFYTAGVIKLIILINAPFYYSLVLNLFRPILRSTIIDKIRIHSKSTSREILLSLMNEEDLPAFLGGKRVDETGDAKCNISQGGRIPENCYYQNSSSQVQLSGSDVLDITIRARSRYDHIVEVSSARSIIRIYFQTSSSIGLSVYFKTKNIPICPEEEIRCEEMCCSPYARIQSHLVSEEMDLYCPEPGTYTFRFDNTYCWTHSKHLLLKVEILPFS